MEIIFNPAGQTGGAASLCINHFTQALTWSFPLASSWLAPDQRPELLFKELNQVWNNINYDVEADMLMGIYRQLDTTLSAMEALPWEVMEDELATQRLADFMETLGRQLRQLYVVTPGSKLISWSIILNPGFIKDGNQRSIYPNLHNYAEFMLQDMAIVLRPALPVFVRADAVLRRCRRTPPRLWNRMLQNIHPLLTELSKQWGRDCFSLMYEFVFSRIDEALAAKPRKLSEEEKISIDEFAPTLVIQKISAFPLFNEAPHFSRMTVLNNELELFIKEKFT